MLHPRPPQAVTPPLLARTQPPVGPGLQKLPWTKGGRVRTLVKPVNVVSQDDPYDYDYA